MKDFNELVMLYQEGAISASELVTQSEYNEEFIQFCEKEKIRPDDQSAENFLDYKDNELMQSQKILGWDN